MASLYNIIGIVYDSQGDSAKAIEHYEKSLAIRLKTLGAEHPNTKSVQGNLEVLRAKSTQSADGGDEPEESGE